MSELRIYRKRLISLGKIVKISRQWSMAGWDLIAVAYDPKSKSDRYLLIKEGA